MNEDLMKYLFFNIDIPVKFYYYNDRCLMVGDNYIPPDAWKECSFIDFLKYKKWKLPFSLKMLKLYLSLGMKCVVKDYNNRLVVLHPSHFSSIGFDENKFKPCNISIRHRAFCTRDFNDIYISYNDIDKL